MTRSIRTALDDLNLAEVILVHAGRESYRLAPGVRAVAVKRLDADMGLWRPDKTMKRKTI